MIDNINESILIEKNDKGAEIGFKQHLLRINGNLYKGEIDAFLKTLKKNNELNYDIYSEKDIKIAFDNFLETNESI